MVCGLASTQRGLDFRRSRTEFEKGCKMYEPFFGMERRPFSATPDPGCFFGSSELQTVLDELTVCVERGQGIGILTAAAGIGKTLICQRLAADLRARDASGSKFECVYLSNSNFPTRRSLLQAILFEMGDEYSRRDEPELRIDLRSRLLSLRPQREALVLIVDEAHLFADELLEELRTLSDLAAEGSSLVRIVLSGQHDLEERLTDRSFDALNQRISTHVFAEPLTISESFDYIRHRLAWAGCDIDFTFTEEAIGIITRASGGVPRCLNQLCDHSLLLAFASDQKPVTEDTVREALEDLKQLPLHWNDVSDGTEVVGYVEDEHEESAETFDGGSEDSFIDADREAALSQLAACGSVESHDDESTESASGDGDADAHDEAGIVESLRAAFEIAPPETQPANATTLADGFEFDFSDSSEDESLASDDKVTASTKHGQNSPQSSSVDVTEHESGFAEHAESSSAMEPENLDETLIQSLLSAAQQTMLEVRSINGPADAEDDNAENDDAGISFQITSDGFELNDFGPPEEIDDQAAEASPADNEKADSGVIEFSFIGKSERDDGALSGSNETVDADSNFVSESVVPEVVEPVAAGNLESANPCSSSEEHTVSAAEITLALFGQDSVLPEHRCDVVMSGHLEAELDEQADAEQPPNEATITDAEAATIEDDPAAEAEETERERFQDKEPEAMNEVVRDETGYEEELVYDPYAALQEPDGAGIVWNVASFSRQVETVEVLDSPEDVAVSVEAESEYSVEEVEICDSVEAAEQADEVATVEQADDPLAVEETSEESTDSASLTAESVDENSEAEVVDASTAEALVEDEDAAVQETFEAVDQSEQIDDEEPQSEAGVTDDEFVAEQFEHPIAEEAQENNGFVQHQHDIVQPVGERPLQPDRLVDAVLPLLDELDEGLDSIMGLGMTGRSVLDIEAELIQTIEHGSDELEDQIGATMLDICLETQSALQDSAAAIRNAEAAELKSFNDLDEATDELPREPFDIVQPEPPGHDESAGYNLEMRFIEPSDEALREDGAVAPSAHEEQVEKPFGRLFSDLRRRKA